MQGPATEPSGHRDAVFGLAEDGGQVLLVLNPRVRKGLAEDLWDLPGGSTQRGEPLQQALVREWREETGLEVAVDDLLFVVDGAKRHADGAVLYTWRAFVFCVHTEGAPIPGAGIREVAWVPAGEAAERLSAPYHAPLRAWLAGGRLRHARVDWVEPAPSEPPAAALPRHLLIVAAAAASGDDALLARELNAAVAGSETPARLVECLLQIVPYAGYPRAISAFHVLRRTLPEAPRSVEPDDEAHMFAARGSGLFEAVYGPTAAAVEASLDELDPVLRRWTLEHAYGRVLAREGALTLLERELLAVSILTALGRLDDPLLGHMRACIRLGASAAQVEGAVRVVPASCGEGRRASALALLQRLGPHG